MSKEAASKEDGRGRNAVSSLMHKLKMEKRYKGKKIVSMKERFLKTAHQRGKMKKGMTKSQMKKEIKQRLKDKKPIYQSRLTDYV